MTQAIHPAGSGVSVLEHLLGEHATIPEDRGLFLEHSFRMHPDVCRYISHAFYAGRLESAAPARPCAAGTGLRWLAVEHEGNRTSSVEEAAAIRGGDRGARPLARGCDGRRALQHAGAAACARASGRARRHRRQVSGPAGGGRLLRWRRRAGRTRRAGSTSSCRGTGSTSPSHARSASRTSSAHPGCWRCRRTIEHMRLAKRATGFVELAR